MTLVTNAKRAEGFLEWRSLGVYGRITELKTEGQTFTFSLGDGGMGGAEFSATARKGILEVHCTQKLRASATGSAQTRELAVNATPLKSAKAFRMLTASYDETPEKGREFSLWLQYLEAVQKNQIPVLDEVLRRSRSPYQMAGFRLTQQKKDYLTVYKAITSTIPSQDGAPGGGAKSAVPAFQYEEVEYPVFISDDMVSIATQNYLLNGGAHGLASTGFDVIDLKRGKRLDVKDILGGDAWKRALAPLLKKELLRQVRFAGVDVDAKIAAAEKENTKERTTSDDDVDLRALGFFERDIEASEDVFVCANGIGFEYDRYQIAPWYMGEFILVLPWSDLKPYVNPEILPVDQP